jgi:DNA helicase-2/ATP-dependent DNA helicase PcrA
VSAVEAITAGLNSEQRAAVLHTEGPLLVLAGAGSGKTRMLTHRVAHLIGSGKAQPWEILAVTFTNKAAREMRERVDALLGAAARGAQVATFHSTCVRILRREIGHLGYEPGFAIYDQADSLALAKRVLRALGIDERTHPPRGVRARIDRLKNRGLWPDDLLRDDSLDARRFARIYQRYQTELRRANALDFGDLLLLAVRLFENHPGVLESYQRRWRYVLVDEYQDTNPVQYRLLRLLVAGHHNLCVVGDEDQSIYRFREADIRNILDFEKDFPGAATVRLERNYRSTQPILDAASAVVANNRERKGKRLVATRGAGRLLCVHQAADERAEAAYVVGELLGLREQGQRLGDCAIFYRTHAQSRAFEEELLKYNLPYTVVGGTRFYDRAEIKDALAYLRVLRNPHDTESLLRIVNSPPRGIGRATLERLLELAAERDASLWSALQIAREEGLMRGAAAPRVSAFIELLEGLRGLDAAGAVSQRLARVLDATGYVRALEQEATVEAEARLENLKELQAAAEEFELANAAAAATAGAGESGEAPRDLLDLFLEQVTLLSEADSLDEREDRAVLMTAHVAKGLEFPAVFVVGLEEAVFPHFAALEDPSAVEEERRLCYVAMTRAQDRLYLTTAALRRLHGATRYNAPSRFLYEIPAALVQGNWSPSRPAPQRAAARSWGDELFEPAAARANGPRAGRVVVDYSEAQWGADDLPSFGEGRRVAHPVFGRGTIVEVVGSGLGAKLRIRFERAGMKTLKVKYAQLELLG